MGRQSKHPKVVFVGEPQQRAVSDLINDRTCHAGKGEGFHTQLFTSVDKPGFPGPPSPILGG
jgi:hypothetical protein